MNSEPNAIELQIAEYFSAIRTKDLRRLMLTFSQDARLYDPVGQPPQIEIAQIKDFFARVFDSFLKVRLTEDSVHVCGTSAAIKWIGTAIGPSGTSSVFAGIDTFECTETGRINDIRAYWNAPPVMALLAL